MKNQIIVLLTLFLTLNLTAQITVIEPSTNDSRTISTGMPFALIAPEARGAALGEMGVATSVDAYSQHWNSAKYAFSETKQGFALSYTPYLSRLVNDIGLAYLTYFNRLDEKSSFSAGFRYFGLGEIEFRESADDIANIQKPNELELDIAYSLKLSEQFAMSVAFNFLRSDLRLNASSNIDATAANTFGVDISGYYQSEEQAYNDFNGRWRAGFAIQNLGPKFKYDEGGLENFQPTNLRLGAGFDFIFDDYNKIAVTAEVTKLLVPTPPILGTEFVFNDNNNNGAYDRPDPNNPQPDDDELISETSGVIYMGQSQDVSFLSGVFQSFGDAPGGFSEELREFTWALGAEYLYQDSFAFRAGYFNENEDKGARKLLAVGAGFKYNVINIDFSYLFSTSKVQSPLEGTLRFSLTFNIGDGTYIEY